MLVGRKEREGMIVEERGGKARVKERERERESNAKQSIFNESTVSPSLHISA